ncbi:unnamed protein product, partial [Ectocarpus sp. 12 AP-2014]
FGLPGLSNTRYTAPHPPEDLGPPRAGAFRSIPSESSTRCTYAEAKPTVTEERRQEAGCVEARKTVRVQLHPEYRQGRLLPLCRRTVKRWLLYTRRPTGRIGGPGQTGILMPPSRNGTGSKSTTRAAWWSWTYPKTT